MNHESIAPLLDDYIDGALSSSAQMDVEAHLKQCARCRKDVAAIRALLRDAGALPRDIQPPHDLWPEIDSRIEEEAETKPLRLKTRSLWSARYPLAAAAVLLIVASSAVTTVVLRSRPPQSTTRLPIASAESRAAISLISQWQATEGEYLRASAELLEALDAVRGSLAPEVAQLIDDNLKLIDEAIRESRAALESDPTNDELMEMLSATYTKKLEVLQQVNRLSASL